MFSKKTKKSIRLRLVLSVALLLTSSLIIVSVTIYFLLSSSLKKSDQNLLLNLRQTYAELYKEGGQKLLQNRVAPEIMLVIINNKEQYLFEHYPLYLDNDFEDEEEVKQIEDSIKTLELKEGWKNILILSGDEDSDFLEKLEYHFRLFAQKKEWNTLLPIIDNDLFEVFISPLDSKHWIIIGKSSEKREEHLSKVRYISLIVIIPFILIGILLSILLSRKILKPIKNLALVITEINNGKTDKRAQIKGTGDEIDLLAKEFNLLIDKNNILVKNLKETVDNVAHDLRTPMTRFRTSAEEALTSNNDTSKIKSALEDAVENSDQILAQLNTIMDIAEVEAGTLSLKFEVISLGRLLKNIIELYRYVADEKDIKIILTSPVEINIRCDIQRMTQALCNILDNAIKYSKPKSSINVLTESTNEQTKIIIEDQGLGISNNELPKIWTRLYRGDSSRSTSGLGIGLSLVKAVIEAHAGEIDIKSVKGEGTTVIITLPICNIPVRTA